MRSEWTEKLADTYPPTPIAFTMAVKRTVAALPARRSQWRFPLPAAVAYALALCAMAALLVFGVGPLQAVVLTAGPTQLAASSTPIPTAAPTFLPVGSMATAPTSADGWQAVAVDGNTTWYYQAKTGELAITENGKTATITLDLEDSQSIKPYTFLCNEQDHWVVFTVSRTSSDTVWLVTNEGRKLVIPGNIYWGPSENNTEHIDLSQARMVPYSNLPLATMARGSDDASFGGLMIYALFPDGSYANMQITVNSSMTNSTVELRQLISGGSDMTVVASRLRTYTISHTQEGGFGIDLYGYRTPLQIQSTRFAMFKVAGELAGTPQPGHALVIYQDDPKHTLWELNIDTGTTRKIAEGCVSADWLSHRSYWYATGADPAVIITQQLDDMKPVSVQAYFTFGEEESDKEASTTRLGIVVDIQNNTGATMDMPETISCDLTLKRDGKTIWQKTTDISLKDARSIFLYHENGIGTGVNAGPYFIPAAQALEITMQDLMVEAKGTYTLEGVIYGNPVKFELTLPYEGLKQWGLN